MTEISTEQLERTIELLEDAASTIWNTEYQAWYSANTMRSFEEWISPTAEDQIDCLRKQADILYTILGDNNV